MATTFKSIIFYSYFKVVADYRIPGRLLGNCPYMLYVIVIPKKDCTMTYNSEFAGICELFLTQQLDI
jgi:hypothetical protein